jgi:hypothetical protein
MVTRRPEDHSDEAGAVARESKGAWRLLLLIVSILGGGAVFLAGDRQLAIAAATTVVEARIGPLEKRFDTHESDDRAAAKMMTLERQQLAETLARIELRLAALCRASSRPQICLGGE